MASLRSGSYSSLNRKIIDALIVGVSFCLAYQLRFDWQMPPDAARQMCLLLPAIVLGRVLVNAALGTYRVVWRLISLPDAVIVARACLAFSLLLLCLRLAAPAGLALLRVPLSIIAIESLLSLEGALGARALCRLLYEGAMAKTLKGSGTTRVLLVGAGQAGLTVSKDIASRADLRPVGFLDDDSGKLGCCFNGLRVLGPLGELSALARKHRVQEVLVCVARPPRALLRSVWAACDELAVPVKIIPTLEEILEGGVNVATFRSLQMRDLLGREPIETPLDGPEVASAYRNKTILITGAGGSIGSELASQLARVNPARLVLLDKDENGLNDACLRMDAEGRPCPVFPVVADIRFPERLETVYSDFRPQVVFHAAAHKHVHLMELNPCEAVLNNVLGTRNVVEKSVAFRASRFVMISTDKAVRPTSIMGATKRVCEMIVQARRNSDCTKFSCVRFGNVLGSRGSVVPIFRRQIERGGPVTLTHEDVRRYLMTIPEAACLVIQAGTLADSGQIFVLDMGEPVPIRKLARDMIELSGLRPERDIRIQVTRLRHGEKLDEVLYDEEREKLAHTPFDKIYSISSRPVDPRSLDEILLALEHAARRESPQAINRILRRLDIGFDGEAGESRPAPEAEPVAVAPAMAGRKI